MKVIVLGSTGFIGFPIAQAFSRAGHVVYGQTRSQEKADSILAPEEIVPIVCDHASEEGKKVWGKLAESADVVIDTVPARAAEAPLATFKLVQSLSRARPEGSSLTFIYTGGSWVHSRGTGDLDTWTDERQPHSGNIELTKWRWEVEKEVLKCDGVNGIVIRPSVLYGRSGSLLVNTVFKPALEAARKGESFETFARKDTRFLMIHQDDLADLYVRVAERGGICKGQAFVGAASQSERLADILDAVVRVSGAKGYTTRPPDENNALEVAWTSSTNLRPTLGNALTGWTTRKMGLVDGMDIYWQSFKASLS